MKLAVDKVLKVNSEDLLSFISPKEKITLLWRNTY